MNPSGAVFLSYASQDAAAVRRLGEALRATGVEVWFDQDELVGGDAWDAKIRGQIASCGLFVPVISASTQARLEGYFRIEWKLAAQRTHAMAEEKAFLLPVVIDGTRDAEAKVPAEFKAVQWTRLPDGEANAAFCARVSRLLAGAVESSGSEPAAGVKEGAGGRAPAAARAGSPRARIAVAVAAVALAVALAFWWGRRGPAGATGPAQGMVRAAAEGPAAAAPDRSIAVLPFANLSDEKEATGFFADGVHEDILTRLALIRGLRVISRTSVVQYRSSGKPLPQIAQELGVAYVLEGSVRRAGNKVRVTGQLIRAATDEHVWAQSYDRDLTDIFAVQADLAQAIATALQAELSPTERQQLDRRPTSNLAAYELYLKARANQYERADGTADRTEVLLQGALELDPEFVAAWAHLASFHLVYYQFTDHTPERLAKVRAALDAAVRLAPEAPETLGALGDFHYITGDFPAALGHFERVSRMRPNQADTEFRVALVRRRWGEWAAALAHLRRATQLDPRNVAYARSLLDTLIGGRRYADARTEQARIMALAPDSLPYAFTHYRLPFLERGDPRPADDWLAGLKLKPADEETGVYLRKSWAGEKGDAERWLELDRRQPNFAGGYDPVFLQELLGAALMQSFGRNDEGAARARRLVPRFQGAVERDPEDFMALAMLGLGQAVAGDLENGLRHVQRSLDLLASRREALISPRIRQTRMWILHRLGRREEALAELASLLQTPFGLNVHVVRAMQGWGELAQDVRFQALLQDPRSNAPLF